jgi:CheY-like chemotaxis protein
METSDRRYQELMALMAGRGHERAQNRIGAMFENRAEMELDVVEPAASANRIIGLRAGFRSARQAALREPAHRHGDLASSRQGRTARAAKGILLVEPDANGARAAQTALRFVADVETCTDFRAARARLLNQPPDLLITNLRLRAYNGLHLVHLAAGTSTRCIVYSTYDDPVLAREVQATGAFFEHSSRLPLVLHSYVNATLPRCDRRNLTTLDRRLAFRGGRRSSDVCSGGAGEL